MDAGRPSWQASQHEAGGFSPARRNRSAPGAVATSGGRTNPGATTGHRGDIVNIDYSRNEESKREGGPHYVAALQDRNSRYVLTKPLQTKSAAVVTNAYRELFEEFRADSIKHVLNPAMPTGIAPATHMDIDSS